MGRRPRVTIAAERPAITPHMANERELLRAPRVAWGTVALVVFVGSAWSFGVLGSIFALVPIWLSITLCTVAAYAAFTGMHESSHLALGRSQHLSVLAGELCASVLLVRFQAFRQVHLRHHRFTNEPDKDPDRWTGLGPRWQLPLRWATTDLNYYREYQLLRVQIPRWQDVISWASAVLLTMLIAGILLTGHGLTFILCWLLPARIALFLAAYLVDYLPHMRPFAPPKSEHRYAHTAVIRGRGASWLMLGHNLHLVHHLYPAVPFYRCGRIWRAKRTELLSRGVREVSLTSLAGPFIRKESA